MAKKKILSDIWKQTPPDYYDNGVKNNIFQYIWHTNKVRMFKKNVPKRKFSKILDIGCASGLMTNKISSFLPNSDINGIDTYKNAIKLAKKKYPSINFICCDSHKLPFTDNSFDLIVCYETIEHVLDPQTALKEMYRVIKKNGVVVIAMDSGNLLFRFVWWIWEKSKGRVWKGAHLHPFHHKQLEEIINMAGFKINKKKFSHFGMEVIFILRK